MKKIVCLLLAGIMLISVYACEKKDGGETEAKENNVITDVTTEKVVTEEVEKISSDYLVSAVTEYNADGKISAVTSYEYDYNCRKISEVYEVMDTFYDFLALRQVANYNYADNTDNIESTTYAVEQIVADSYSDDYKKVLTTKTYTYGGWIEYLYDSSGQSTEYNYSDEGELISETIVDKKGKATTKIDYYDNSTWILSYEYDEHGNVVMENETKTDKLGYITDNYPREYHNEYNEVGLITKHENLHNHSYYAYIYDENYCLSRVDFYELDGDFVLTSWEEYSYISKNDVIVTTELIEQETEGNIVTKDNVINEETAYLIYENKINEYIDATSMDRDSFYAKYDYGNDCSSINAHIISYFHSSEEKTIFYAIYDVDNNGVFELIFSDNYNHIIDIYTLKKDSIIKLYKNCSFGDRSHLYLLSDGNLFTEGSSGASSSSCELSYIGDDGKLIVKEAYYYDDYFGRSDYMDEDYIYLSSSEYFDKIKYCKEKVIEELPWIAITR